MYPYCTKMLGTIGYAMRRHLGDLEVMNFDNLLYNIYTLSFL